MSKSSKRTTDAESIMWLYLRNRQIYGVKFRRQFSIENYILDFYAPSHQLAIEIDGGQHYEEQGEKKDKIRTGRLNALGIRVLRFSNTEVLTNMDGIYDIIEDFLEKHPSS